MLKQFKDFLMRGNLIDLAVAFVIGTAFAALVNALVADLITPIIAAFAGEPDFAGLTFSINDSEFKYGDFINALITFVSIAAAVFFLVVKPAQRLGMAPPPPEMKNCPECTSSIPLGARRCPNCTAQIGAAA
jgi:large conductance mechanosensitive channel